jgi:hypothetical protein
MKKYSELLIFLGAIGLAVFATWKVCTLEESISPEERLKKDTHYVITNRIKVERLTSALPYGTSILKIDDTVRVLVYTTASGSSMIQLK